nr:thioesterase family protein [Kutzneria chonburiensis]
MTTFADVTAVSAMAPFEFKADISPRWTIVGHPNGGYLLAMIGRAVTELSAHPHVLAASAHFLRSPEPGPARIEVEPLRAGRSTSQLRGRLLVDDKPCVEATFTLGTLAPNSEPAWQRGLPDPAMTDPAAAIRLPAVTPGGQPAAMMAEADVRLDPDSHQVFAGTPSGRGEIRAGSRCPAAWRSTRFPCCTRWTRFRRPRSTSPRPVGWPPWSSRRTCGRCRRPDRCGW